MTYRETRIQKWAAVDAVLKNTLLATRSVDATAKLLGVPPRRLGQHLLTKAHKKWWLAIKKRWKAQHQAARVARWRARKRAKALLEHFPPEKRRMSLSPGDLAAIERLLASGHRDPWI